MPRIKIPAVLAGGSATAVHDVPGGTVREALDNHASEHGPDLRNSVLSEDGSVKEFINLYVNGEEVGHLDGLDTSLEADDEIRVIPAASGGSNRSVTR